jgi:4-amino-4-deoxy-L-arabinose transferase-like glycosyltransferase
MSTTINSNSGFIRQWAWLWPLLLLIVIGNIVGWLSVGIHPDEAYYWVWSEHLQGGYFDHPSGVAWIIRLFTSVFGDHAWSIRLPAVLAWLAISFSVYLIGRDAFPSGKIAGWMSVLVAGSLPLYQIGFHVITPDAPYLLFTSLAYLVLYLALTRDSRWWLAVGVFGGLALVSKYIAVLFPAGIFLALLFSAPGRRILVSPWPWLAAVVAFLLFTPVIVWNARHEWVSFLFQLGHGINLKQEASIVNVLLFLGSQLVVAMPWTFIAMIIFSAKRQKSLIGIDPLHHVLAVGFGLPIIFFSLTGFTMISGAHWPAAAYIPGSVLLGGILGEWLQEKQGAGKQAKFWHRRGPVLLIVVAGLLAISVANIARYRVNTQLANTFGWPQLAAAVGPVYAHEQARGDCVIATQNWGLSSAIAFALNKPNQVTVLPGGRISQFDIWRNDNKNKPQPVPCVLVAMSDHSGEFPENKSTGDSQAWQLQKVIELISPIRPRWAAIYVRQDLGAR